MGGNGRRLGVALLAAVVGLAGCATAGADRAASSREGASAPRATGATASGDGPVSTGDARRSALNGWILSRSAAASTPDLPLGPGDLITVNVFLVAELSNLKIRVPSTGTIALPLIGSMPAAGRTARELEEELKARLRQYMHDPQVAVFVDEHKSQQVAVFGAVRSGGVYPLVSQLRVTDALALAGALNDDADHVVYLFRRSRADEAGPPSDPSAPVASRGAEPRRPTNETAPAASATAAATDATQPAGDDVMIPIDLETVMSGRQELNLPLRAGDVIHVPRAGSYYVGGAVSNPGSFVLKRKTTLHQAVVAAGWVKQTADWDDVRVYRTNRDGKPETFTFSLNELEEHPGTTAPEIKSNDVVIVGQSALKRLGYGILDFIRFGVGASVPF